MSLSTCRVSVLLLLLVAHSPPAFASDVEATDTRHAAFAEALTGATLVGHFTEGDDDPPLNAERYELKQVRHVEGDNWLFACRIKYGERDLTVPLVLPVYWADKTPVITLDKLPVPGIGTFSARVLIHDGYYAGYWSGEGHGGHLFGRIERPSAETPAEE